MSTILPRSGVRDFWLPALVAATVFAFAAGSSSIHVVKVVGLDARWVMLCLLAAAGIAGARSHAPARTLIFLASGLPLLAFISALWSVAPRSSAAHAASLVLLFATAVLLSAGVTEERAQQLLTGLLAGAGAVAVAGVVLLAASYGTAVVAATIESPARFRGFGEDANTVALLLALATPLAVVGAVAARTRGRRAIAIALLVLFIATITGSGSRGALFAATIGALLASVLRAATLRGRSTAVLAVVVVAVCSAVLQSVPRNASLAPPPAASSQAAASAPPPQRPRYVDVQQVYPLDADVGRPLPGGGEPDIRRSYFGSSGRVEAWRGALGEVAGRPFAGYGFGTEARVFDDRYYYFVGALPENSYIGIALQLGAVGLVLMLGIIALLVLRGRHRLRMRSPVALACLGVVASGVAVAVVQSYLYSVGNLATTTFWIAAFLLAASASEQVQR